MIPDSLFNIDFGVATQQLYPSHKRLPNLLAIAFSLFGANLNAIQQFFLYYRNGADNEGCPVYDSGTVYTFGQMVIWNRRVYYRNEITAGYAAGALPSSTYWQMILKSFIGMNEQIHFGPGRLIMEYMLNRTFSPYGAAFVQPTSYGATGTVVNGVLTSGGDYSPKSAIWIRNNPTGLTTFYIGQTTGSAIAKTDANQNYYIPLDDANNANADFTINVPNAVLAAIGSLFGDASPYPIAKSIVASVASVYKPSGYTLIVTGY